MKTWIKQFSYSLFQLKNDQIIISSEDVEEMRTKALNAIEETKEVAIQSIDAKVQLSLDELNKKTDMKLNDLCQAVWSKTKEGNIWFIILL